MLQIFLLTLLLLLSTSMLSAQNLDGNYNPYVNSGTISPSPLLPLQVNGTGIVSFNIGNTGSDPLEIFTDQFITLTITLSFGEPDNVDPIAAIGGTSKDYFSWTYNAGTYTAIQTSVIPANSSGTITIDYKVTSNSASPGSNGFNVNITPAPYQIGINSQDDDQVNSYTYTEIRDYGDAPAVYGSADHTIDFENYLGALVDGESSYLASAAADGDDLSVMDDEDGVIFPATIHQGENINISVTAVGLGRLNAWVDWNGDGDFSDAGEQVASNVVGSDETLNLTVTVPTDAIISAPTFARFRFSPGTLSSSTGSAIGGEVEDYQLNILCAPPIPTLTISETDSSYCAGTSVIFTAGGGTSYDFRIGGVIAQTGSSNIFTTNLLTNGQVVDVIVTDAIGCQATSSGITNTVFALPTPTLSSSENDNAFCLGSPVTFTAGGGTLYDFRIDEASVQTGTSNTYITSSLANNQVLTVMVTNLEGCDSLSTGITNTVYPLPVPTLTSSDADSAFCAGTSITFSATGGVNYDFRVDDLSRQNSGLANFTLSSLTNGQIVDVLVTDNNGCEAVSGGITNTVFELPTVNAGTVLSPICQGSTTVSLGGSVGGSATGGYWSSPQGGVFSPDSASLSATWTPPAGYSGTASLILTSTGGNCGSVSSGKTQLVNPNPQVIITDPADVCSPSTVDLTNASITTGSTAGLTYTYWTDAAATTSLLTPTAATAGTYYLLGTLASTGCSDIAAVTVTVNPTPTAPVVVVTDNCDGTSVLSTSASGSLLWNTGATTSSITVNTPDIFTVNTTIDGCTSADGSGTSSPNTAPAPPVVSSSVIENVCPEITVNISSLVSSIMPTGGSIVYKTTNDPLGVNVSNPAAVGSGSYYIFYQSQDGCYSSGTEVVATINNCPPDLTPTLIVSPNIMHGITSFDLIVKVTELNNENTSGVIVVNIPKDSRWILTDGYVPGLTILGSTPLNNNDWSYSQDAINHIFTSSAVINGGGYSIFGFRVSFDPGNSRGLYSITSQLVSGGGGEERVSNNVDSEKIDYFQE